MDVSESVLLVGVVISYSICFVLAYYYMHKDAYEHEKNWLFLILMTLPAFAVIWIVGFLLFLLIKLIAGYI